MQISRFRGITVIPFARNTARYQSLLSTRNLRAFSSTSQRHGVGDEIVDVLTFIPRHTLTLVHDYTFLPWWAAIPLSAMLWRAGMTYYPKSRYHDQARLKQALSPLSNAILYSHIRDKQASGSKSRRITPEYIREDQKAARKKGQAMYDRFGLWRSWYEHAWNVVVVLVGAEAVRLKLGAGDGALGLIQIGLKALFRPFLVVPPASSEKPYIPADPQPVPLQQEIDILAAPTQDLPTDFDASVLVEGLSWCPDLTVADPLGIVPGVTAGIMLANVVLRHSRSEAGTLAEWFGTFNAFDKLGLVWTGVFWYLAQGLPVGILLYFSSGLVTNKILTVWLHVRNPIPKRIPPCRPDNRWKMNPAD